MILVRANSLELVKVLDDSSVSDHFPLRPILNIAINDPKKKKSIWIYWNINKKILIFLLVIISNCKNISTLVSSYQYIKI